MSKINSPTYRCGCCSAGGTLHSAVERHCFKCGSALGHVCKFCRARNEPMVCLKCRPHICLSKCTNRCIKKPVTKKPDCGCKEGPIRLIVKKDGANNGKHFWSCRPCNFFEWD